jgi:hypothetical protein
MSWDIDLKHPDGTLAKVEEHQEGGTYVAGRMVDGEFVPGGLAEASLNMTYNYGRLLASMAVHPDSDLNGKKAGDTSEALNNAFNRFALMSHTPIADMDHIPDAPCGDYWHDCPENVAKAVAILCKWAKQHPDAVWEVT